MTVPTTVWRLGHAKDPVGFTPRPLCSWTNRFDDPQKSYQTLYVAEERLTCFLGVFQDLRPDAEAMALLSQLEDAGDGHDDSDAGTLTQEHLNNRVITLARVMPPAVKALDVEDLNVRRELALRLAPTLVRNEIKYLDLGEVRGNNRALTQAISRLVYDDGYHLLSFSSKIDGLRCFVLFEERSHLQQAGPAEPLAEELPEVQAVCQLFGLKYRS